MPSEPDRLAELSLDDAAGLLLSRARYLVRAGPAPAGDAEAVARLAAARDAWFRSVEGWMARWVAQEEAGDE